MSSSRFLLVSPIVDSILQQKAIAASEKGLDRWFGFEACMKCDWRLLALEAPRAMPLFLARHNGGLSEVRLADGTTWHNSSRQ